MERANVKGVGRKHQPDREGIDDGAFRDGDERSQGFGGQASCCYRDVIIGQREPLTSMVRKAYRLMGKKAEETIRHFDDQSKEVSPE
jgi:hypothetical protein